MEALGGGMSLAPPPVRAALSLPPITALSSMLSARSSTVSQPGACPSGKLIVK